MKRQLSSITTDHGNYSEIFVHSPMGSGIGRLILDPHSMMLFSTHADDFERIKTMRQQHGMSADQAIAKLLGEKQKAVHRRRASDLAAYNETN